MFGIEAHWDGSIVICPHPPTFAPEIELRGLRLRGRTIDVRVKGGQFEVTSGGKTLRAKVGQSVRLAE
jgi:hypothetical protein